MDKRFQVFVSSTYRDLQDERREAMQALLELDCIPAGMELFPAANDESWKLIERVISQSDYYVLIVGGRYGSLSADGISFTEREYEHAFALKIPVHAFLHADPSSIPVAKSELEPTAQVKLEAFRAKIKSRHSIREWTSATDLGAKMSRSLIAVFRSSPGIGWIRGDTAATPDLLQRMNKLTEENVALRNEIEEFKTRAPQGSDVFSQGSDLIPVNFTFDAYSDYALKLLKQEIGHVSRDIEYSERVPFSWDAAFGVVGPLMFEEASESRMKYALEEAIPSRMTVRTAFYRRQGTRPELADDDFQLIKIQLVTLGLIQQSAKKHAVGDKITYWTLTPYGRNYLLQLRAIRREKE